MFEKLEFKYPQKIPYTYMFIAALFNSLNAFCAKMLTSTETFEILFLRSIIMILMLFAYYGKSASPKEVKINDR